MVLTTPVAPVAAEPKPKKPRGRPVGYRMKAKEPRLAELVVVTQNAPLQEQPKFEHYVVEEQTRLKVLLERHAPLNGQEEAQSPY